jgi:predicted nucleotidyltransferase
MINRNEILEFLDTYRDVILEKYQLKFLALFGSYARMEQNEKSDIDLLIEFKEGVESIHKMKKELKEEIFEKFNLEVDICRNKYIKDCFRNLIYRDAINF